MNECSDRSPRVNGADLVARWPLGARPRERLPVKVLTADSSTKTRRSGGSKQISATYFIRFSAEASQALGDSWQ